MLNIKNKGENQIVSQKRKPKPKPKPKPKRKEPEYDEESSDEETPPPRARRARATQPEPLDRAALAADVLGLLQQQHYARASARRSHYASWFQDM